MKKALFLIILFEIILSYHSQAQVQTPTFYGMTTVGGQYGGGTIFNTNSDGSDFKTDYSFSWEPTYPRGSVIQAANGLLYGMAPFGGAYNNGGVIFSYDITDSTYHVVYSFGKNGDGADPYGSLIQGKDGLLYGMTTVGGNHAYGTIFSFNTLTGIETVLYKFNSSTDGASPAGSLIQASDSLLYGLTSVGGPNGLGTIFSYNITTNAFTKLYDFKSGTTDGNSPNGSLIEATNGILYGMTPEGGTNNFGVIFSYNILSGIENKLHDFSGGAIDGQSGYGSFIQATNGLLYGLTKKGGASNGGAIISYNFDKGTDTLLYDLGKNGDMNPLGTLVQASDGKLYGLTENPGGAVFSYTITNGQLTNINTFTLTNGSHPMNSLIQATDGLLYGLAYDGGVANKGVLFKCDTNNKTITDLHDFGSSNIGQNPYGSLIQVDSLLYGVTIYGGKYNSGTIFSFNPHSEVLTTLYSFGYNHDATNPVGALIKATNGTLYGIASIGSNYTLNGSIFSYNIATNTYTLLTNFSNSTISTTFDGSLIQGKDGLLYGLSFLGGKYGTGTIFNYNISTNNDSVLYNFNDSSQYCNSPAGSLLQVDDSLMYGTTQNGGQPYGEGGLFKFNTITGKLTYVYQFGTASSKDGHSPSGNLIQAYDGLLYGMTTKGGPDNFYGNLYSYNPITAAYTSIHGFDSYTNDAEFPRYNSLIQGSDSVLYGMTTAGGTKDSGTIISYNISSANYSIIHNFSSIDGALPFGNLVQYYDSAHDIITGIKQLPDNHDLLLVYPNPTTNQLSIISNQQINEVKITNTFGQVVLTHEFSKGSLKTSIIDVHSFPEGIYFITTTTTTGAITKKIVISRND